MIKRDDVKKSIGLSKSTKTLLIIVIAIIIIAVIFLVVKGLSNPNDNENPVERLTADLKISQVEILNNTDLNVKVDEGTVEGEIQAINFIFYNEDGNEIKRSQISVSDLEENDYLISFRVINTSKIKSISITPIFVNKSGGSIIGKIEDKYIMTGEENTNNNENNNEENTSSEENTSLGVLPECTLDTECNDNNGCTSDSCVEGNCSHTLVENCVPCSISSQCDDSNACTTNVCSEGKCTYLAIPGCTPCGSNLNCEDNNSCTNNICMQERCLYTPIQNCKICTLDSDCEDNEACTSNTCSNGACVFTSVSNCKVCTLSSQCEDNDSSTTSSCSNGKCVYTKITACISNDGYCPSGCTAANDNDCSYICGNGIREGNEKCDGTNLGGATCSGVLGTGYTGTLKCFSSLCTFDTSLCVAPCTCSDDGNSCTTDSCINGICQHTSLTGNSCLSDGNVCTNDLCGVNGTCAHAPISGCCISSSQCGSGKVCTNNVCVTSSNPPTETCYDEIKNQGETGIDCGGPCSVCYVPLRTYYISTLGSDSTGNGSNAKPWKSLAYACSKATTPGDLIHIKTGNYIETDECVLAVGVSIEGEGPASHIISHYATIRSSSGIPGAAIALISLSEGTNGNQTISYLTLDGDGLLGHSDGTLAYQGILVFKRSNVKIHNLTIVDFYTGAVAFDATSVYNQPSIYGIGNEFYNNNLKDNGDTDGTWGSNGQIEFTGQDGIKIHDNIIDGTGKAQGHNGNIVGAGYYNKGTKYYRNKSYKPDYDGSAWNFHIESWDTMGGTEIYDNEFHGGDDPIDIGGHFNIKGNYSYSWYIHNNLFTGTPTTNGNGKMAIDIEGPSTNDIWIYYNHFLNIPTAVTKDNGWSGDCNSNTIYIAYNLMENMGWSSGNQYDAILKFYTESSGSKTSNVYIYNNVISSSSSTHNLGIDIRNLGTMSNFNIKNNIIVNNGNVGFLRVMNNNVNGLYIDNNILYNNANSDNPVISGSNYEFSGNIKANPLFVSSSDFHLQSQNSPAINNGVNVGLTKDYEGSSVPKGSAPDIGAYEYGSSVPVCTCASDGDVCTTDICQNNVCQHIQINNCCTSSSQCGSGQTCTGNACVVTSNPPTSTTGKVYYVATNGKDTNSGTSISSPFATINQAWSMVSAGDTIYVRGGTYTYSMIGETVLSGKSGTAGKMINILNYPEEKPIIDFSSNTFTSQVMGIRLQSANYIYIKGIRVTSINQPHQGGIAQYGMILWDHVSNSIFEQMETDHIGGWGVVIGDASNNNLFLNCDSHHNSDRYSTNGEPWGWSDGFQSNSWDANYAGQASTGNVFRGCRSYWNSDDGWDLRRASGLWTIDHCWSFMNGRKPGEKNGDSDVDVTGGNGEAYKLGQSFQDGTTDIKRILVNSLSYNNACGVEAVSGEANGILYNGAIGMQIYNNVFYHDQVGVNIQKDADGNIGNIYFYNNIIHGYTTFAAYEFQEIPHHSNNIFTANDFYHQGTPDLSSTGSNSDFLSLDPSCMDDPRKADGSLPDCSFLHLASSSKLIDAGVNVGLPFNGKAPDLGAYESNY